MVIEASVVAGYLIAWAARRMRRVEGRLATEADVVIDAGLDRLHEVVAAKLAENPVLAGLVEEADNGGEVSELTRTQLEVALAAAAKDEDFLEAVSGLVAQLRQAERTLGSTRTAGLGPAIFTGNAYARAQGGGIAVGQVAGDMNVGPQRPGRAGH